MRSEKYDIIIGLEVHVQMKTASKMFCSCDNDSEDVVPNTNVCPVCLGHPGTLPVLNGQAVEWGVKTALALNCEIPARSKFDRKNYFYPDLPKGYQISQFDEPIGGKGYLLVQMHDDRFRVGITRLHLEEDAGKLVHPENADYSLVDYNRGGTPLMEIVSEPQIKTPAQAKAYLEELKQVVQYLGVSDADMEKGQLRCDANISLRHMGDPALYPKTEIKNLNSFRAVEKALQYEIARQKELWEDGKTPEHATRGWDDAKEETVLQRTKEDAADYRYFPEPDIPILTFTVEQIAAWKKALPELPDSMRERFGEEYGIDAASGDVLTANRGVATFFEETVSETLEYLSSRLKQQTLAENDRKKVIKLIVSWITTQVFRLINEAQVTFDDLRITPENMAELIVMLYNNDINSSAGQTILKEMFDKGQDPSQIAEKLDLKQVSDESVISDAVQKVLDANPEIVQQIRNGKTNATQFLVGQVMKETKGKANPNMVQQLIQQKI